MDTRHNGWHNGATWHAALAIDSYYGPHMYRMEIVRDCLDDASRCERELRIAFQDMVDGVQPAWTYGQAVNWREIAENWISDEIAEGGE